MRGYSYCLVGKTLICVLFFFFNRSSEGNKRKKKNLVYLSKCPEADLLSLSLPSYDLYVGKGDCEVECTVFYEGVGMANSADALHCTRVQTGTMLLLHWKCGSLSSLFLCKR